MTNLKEIAGDVTLGGIYTLHTRIREDREGAFFAGSTPHGKRRLIKLVPSDSPGARNRFAIWQRLLCLRHPSLLDVLDVRRCELSGRYYYCLVCEYPDDVLASGLGGGPLSDRDTRAVLEAALAALGYLHGHGLVHGAVDPDHIVAVGETVKLSADALHESDDRAVHAEDMRQLAQLAATLRAPESLSEPLAAIVRAATALDAGPAAPLVVAVGPPAGSPEATAPPRRPFPMWIVAAVAVLLVSILMFNLRRQPHSAQPKPAPPIAAPAAGPAPPLPVVASSTPPPAGTMWRVIAFTYRTRDMAAKKAKQINDRWPVLHASVFEPKEPGGYYLVALGDRMNRDAAERLQSKARSLGLPRDTYVQNYSE